MRPTALLAALILASMAMLVAPGARADAPCDKGFRNSTAGERATMTAVLTTVKNALPPAPAGWQIVSGDEITPTAKICRDNERRSWNYQFTRTYRQVGDYEARQKKFAEAVARIDAERQAKQPRLDALMVQNMELGERQVALMQKGDMAGAQKINLEMEKLQNEYQKIAQSGNSEQILAAAGTEMNRDLEMSISGRINPWTEAPMSGAQNLTLPAGAFAAYRWDTTSENLDQGHALFLYGKWMRSAQGRWQPGRPCQCRRRRGQRHFGQRPRGSEPARVNASGDRLSGLVDGSRQVA